MTTFTNYLINETSPYLLQHAHNPVNWYAWGDEALKKAKQDDKPILVSIGYSACHWCHVMEKESFEDEVTAKLMNDNFINIKIDREERPDLDHIYMDAVQAMTGSGGWPLNIFLTPDCKPFYGGTYFPPVKAFNRASWKDVLTGVAQLFKERRTEAEAQADELTKHIQQSNDLLKSKTILPDLEDDKIFTRQQNDTIFSNIMKQADEVWGGFGNAPKFPQSFTINYLFRYYHFTKKKSALHHACLSLDKMIDGGIYDQIGGGFSRYSTDKEWLAPHFEKMLYDNALLISTLCDAFKIAKNIKYKSAVDDTINFIERELMNNESGFYSALDADSEGEEGKFYVWSYDEIHEILKTDADLFCDYYDVSKNGNWEHKNILRVLKPLHVFVGEKKMNENVLEQFLQTSSNKLLQHRNKRIRPSTDDKILLGWNALMNISLCNASAAFNNEYYKELAVKNFNFLWKKFRVRENDFSFHHTYKNGNAKYPAFLDDYAYLIQACIHLQEITSDTIYLENARSLTEYVIDNFSDEESSYFFYTGKKQKDVIIRKKEIYDSAIPSGNSVMATNLIYLSFIYNNSEWKQRGIDLLNNISQIVIKYPTSFGNWACLMIDLAEEIHEIAVVGEDYKNLKDELLQYFIPNKVLQCAGIDESSKFPLLMNKNFKKNALIYACKNYTCSFPVNTIKQLLNQIKREI